MSSEPARPSRVSSTCGGKRQHGAVNLMEEILIYRNIIAKFLGNSQRTTAIDDVAAALAYKIWNIAFNI